MGMVVLLAGIGGSAHAFAWSLAQSSVVDRIECAGVNTGVARFGRCHDIDPADPIALADLAERVGADVVVPFSGRDLAVGIADPTRERGIGVFGPSRVAAQLEGSKAFFKDLASETGVPTPRFEIFDGPEEALAGLDRWDGPCVVKSSGHARSQAVVLCDDRKDAERAVREVLTHRNPGISESKIVVEERVEGPEVSFFAVTDGRDIRLLPAARDFKRIGDGNTGPNTAGMGAMSPVPGLTLDTASGLLSTHVQPLVDGMRARGIDFTGVLYAGLIETSSGWQVLEVNVRPGDPEAQAFIPRLRTDLGVLIRETVAGRLGGLAVEEKPGAAVCVALAAAGYPGDQERQVPISGLDEDLGALVFHAGMVERDGQLFTKVGRVMHVVGQGTDLSAARAAAYGAIERISFDGMQFRTDIAAGA